MRVVYRRRGIAGWLLACLVMAGGADLARCAAAEVLVADQVGDRIVAFDAETGAYTRTLWSTDERVQPSAMVIGPGGDLFVANRLGRNVLRIASEDLGGSNVVATTFAADLFYPGSLAYRAGTDSLLVGEFGVYPGGPLGDEIFVYDGAGDVQATLTLPQVGIAGMAFDAAGDVYASGFFTSPAAAGRIYKFSGPPSWQSQGAFAPDPYPWAELQGAAGIAFDADGDMLVAGLITANAGAIVKFDLDNGQLVGQERLGDFIPFPSGLLMLDDGQLLVSSLGFGPTSGSVYRFNPETGARSVLLGGDFNQDGVVDAVDLNLWRDNYASGGAQADADADGDTNGADFLAWQRGQGLPSAPGLFSPSGFVVYDAPGASNVPEPSSATLGAVALVAATWSSRRRSRRAAVGL